MLNKRSRTYSSGFNLSMEDENNHHITDQPMSSVRRDALTSAHSGASRYPQRTARSEPTGGVANSIKAFQASVSPHDLLVTTRLGIGSRNKFNSQSKKLVPKSPQQAASANCNLSNRKRIRQQHTGGHTWRPLDQLTKPSENPSSHLVPSHRGHHAVSSFS